MLFPLAGALCPLFGMCPLMGHVPCVWAPRDGGDDCSWSPVSWTMISPRVLLGHWELVSTRDIAVGGGF